MPRSTIIIAARNQERFLGRAIDSALGQDSTAEVVVVDDGSTDGSRDIVRGYGNAIIPVFREWTGQGASINAGIEAASGSLLFLLDGDDLADRERVPTVEERFAEDPDVAWLRHSLRSIDEEDRVLVPSSYDFGAHPDAMEREVVREGRTVGTNSGLVFRASFFERLGPIPLHYTTYPDWYLLVRGALTGGGASLQEPLGSHRWHASQFTAYDWRQVERAPFQLLLRKHLAEDAAAVAAATGGPEDVARCATWWQLKAVAEARRAGLVAERAWARPFGSFLRALASSDLAAQRKALLALRGALLAAVPRSQFQAAWWAAHVGRPSILGRNARDRLV